MDDIELPPSKRSKLAKGATALVKSGIIGAAAAGEARLGLPPGAVVATGVLAGTASIAFISDIAAEVLQRSTEQRQKDRIRRIVLYAEERFRQNIENGRSIRVDDFFDAPLTDQSKGKEIIEGVLLKARDTYQEKKLRYLGNILANAACSTYDAALIHNVLKLADEMTYRGLVCIAVVGRLDEFQAVLPPPNAEVNDGDEANSVLIELESLLRRDMVSRFEPRRPFTIEAVQSGPAKPFVIPVGTLVLTPLGNAMYTLMGLETVPKDDIRSLVIAPLLS